MAEELILSEEVKNALSEIGNIGAGNAATSLSMMLSQRLSLSPPKVMLCTFDELLHTLGGEDANVCAILSDVRGGVNAMILFVMGLEDAKKLDHQLLGENVDWHSEMGLSAVKEIGNILIGSYVSSLEMLAGEKIRYTLPELSIDMAGTILSVPCVEFGMDSDRLLLIESDFAVDGLLINGHIMVLSVTGNYEHLLHSLGVE